MTRMDSPKYSPGLEGVIAGETAVGAVDATVGLLYRGYDIHDLAERGSFEEIAWLLLRGELPTIADCESFRKELADEASLPDGLLAMLRLLPPATHPIDALRTAVSMLAGFDPELSDHSHAANLRKSIRIVAWLPAIVTDGWRIARGEETFSPGQNLTHAARFLFSLTGREPQAWEISALNIVLVLYAEHEFNASTFAARVTASTLSDIYAAITTAIGTLKGPLHGGANEAAMNVLREVGAAENADAWVKDHLSRHEKVMGFGHRVYRSGDSRVPMMRRLAKDLGERLGQPQWHAICVALEAAMEREKHLYANVDLYAAPVLYMTGIPPELNTSIFAVARVAGWCAHTIEQHDHNRLIRPRSLYVGPARRKPTAGGTPLSS